MPTTRVVVLSTSGLAACYSLWKILQWRARKRAQSALEEIALHEGPLIQASNFGQRQRVLAAATQRASKWGSLFKSATPLVDQVGGLSLHDDKKKPVLSLPPDYILKPLRMDHRGIREVHFYEAVFHSQELDQRSANVGKGNANTRSWLDYLDTFAMATALILQDRVILDSEQALHQLRKKRKRQADLLRRLAPFVPVYYGVVGQTATAHLTQDAHVLLHNALSNMTSPCVMDLKMGQESFEPDAPLEKRIRESQKYPLQSQMGFRIVGMRVCTTAMTMANESDPSPPSHKMYDKSYGRSLLSYSAVVDAFAIFLQYASDRCLSNLLVQLRPIVRWFEKEENDGLQFCASSLLIAYEGNVVSLKMIDFGRVRYRMGGDPGYRHGLHTLQTILTTLEKQGEGRRRRNCV